jgi:hypothetical protein
VKEEQCLSNKLIKRVQKIVNESRGSPQVHLFVLGNVEKKDNIPNIKIVEQFEKLSLVSKSNEKIQFIITSVIPKNGPTDHICLQLNELLKEKKFVPQTNTNYKQDFVGGFVHQPTPGMYKWIKVKDIELNSTKIKTSVSYPVMKIKDEMEIEEEDLD